MAKEKVKEKEAEVSSEEEVTSEELEKALDKALLKANAPDFEDEEEEEEEEEEKEPPKKILKKKVKKSKDDDEDPDFEALSKSLEETMEEEDEEASEVLNALPFVKALVDSMETQLVEVLKALVQQSDKIDEMGERLEKAEEIAIAEAKLIKSISGTVREMGDEVTTPIKSQLGKHLTIVRKSEGEADKKMELTKSEALAKLTTLCKSKKITLKEVISLESKIQKGQEIPEKIQELLVSNE